MELLSGGQLSKNLGAEAQAKALQGGASRGKIGKDQARMGLVFTDSSHHGDGMWCGMVWGWLKENYED